MDYPKIETPYCLHEEVVRPEWIDSNGHMSALHYTEALTEPMGKFFTMLGLGHRFSAETGRGIFLLDWRIQYVREVLEGTSLRFETRLLDASDKVLHYYTEMLAGDEQYLAATSESAEIHMDLQTRRPAPFEPGLQEYLREMLEAHRKLPWPERAGNRLGIRPKA